MRLIDADELIKNLQEMADLEWNQQVGSSKGIEDAIDVIENFPTVEDRPTGKWIIDGHHYKCSRCGKTLAIMFSETDDDLIGCPFCLADMRKDAENE